MLRELRRNLVALTTTRRGSPLAAGHQRLRPVLECLEDRTVPAALSYSSYLPGPAFAIAVDSAGEAFVAGTTSLDIFSGSGSAYVAKLNATGLLYLTYLGSNGHNMAGGIALDSAGNAYVSGWTSSTNFPTTSNAAFPASSAFPGGNAQAGFVTELGPTGALVYSTYLPGDIDGSANSPGGAIVVDGSGAIYLTGSAGPGLPTTANAFQASFLGGTGYGNAFLAKINPFLSGPAALLYVSYLGGRSDAGTGIAVDASGNAYLAGWTSSTNFPTTPGALQRTYGGGGDDAFVAKVNPSLTGAASLVYSTYLGGKGWDGYRSDDPAIINVIQSGPGIAVDSTGDAFITGSTTSTNFPTTVGSFQPAYAIAGSTANRGDAFVTKLNATGSALVYSTYLGGSNLDGGSGIAMDGAGNAYVTGWTRSTNFPTMNPIQAQKCSGIDSNHNPNSDVFVATLNASGSGLLFSTYFGGGNNDYGMGIALDAAANAYVSGQTSSSNFPTTAGALQSSAGSGFVFEIDPPAGGAPASPATLPICLPVPDGSTFTVPGNQGETNRSDLLTARKHEPGYPLGLKHTDDRVAVGFLASAAGQVHGANLKADDPALLDQLFAAWPD